jgi:hypothetical protein
LPKEVAAEFKGLLGDIKELKAFAKEGYRGVIADVSQQLEAIRKADAPKITTGKDTNAAAQAMADLVQDTVMVKVAQWVASMPVASKPGEAVIDACGQQSGSRSPVRKSRSVTTCRHCVTPWRWRSPMLERPTRRTIKRSAM